MNKEFDIDKLVGVWRQVPGAGFNMVAMPVKTGEIAPFKDKGRDFLCKIARMDETLEFRKDSLDNFVKYEQRIKNVDTGKFIHREGSFNDDKIPGKISVEAKPKGGNINRYLRLPDEDDFSKEKESQVFLRREGQSFIGNKLSMVGIGDCLTGKNIKTEITSILKLSSNRFKTHPIRHDGAIEDIEKLEEIYTKTYIQEVSRFPELTVEKLIHPILIAEENFNKLNSPIKDAMRFYVLARDKKQQLLDIGIKEEDLNSKASLGLLRINADDENFTTEIEIPKKVDHQDTTCPFLEADSFWFLNDKGVEHIFYVQQLYLNFFGILWPHFSLNLLKKIS